VTSHRFAMPLHRWVLILACSIAVEGWSAEPGGPGRLRHVAPDQLESVLPGGTAIMIRPSAIEHFLVELDGQPPDWATLYGAGHHDPGVDDRLFALNRERDAKRAGRTALSRRIAFVWTGTLSRYDPAVGGFPVALGPNVIETKWGMVRFKPEEAPGNLSVVTDASDQLRFERLLSQGKPVEIDVVMTGTLIPDESIVYDFSHEAEGVGLIMPFVRVEQVMFLLSRPDPNRR
jgi:hypothetical protein